MIAAVCMTESLADSERRRYERLSEEEGAIVVLFLCNIGASAPLVSVSSAPWPTNVHSGGIAGPRYLQALVESLSQSHREFVFPSNTQQ